MGIAAYNDECRAIVMRYSGEWERTVRRLGRWIDFKGGYKTLDPSYMESVWWVFKQLHEKGLVYRGFKVMPFSTACATPLSNFEAGLNYKDVQDPAVSVRTARARALPCRGISCCASLSFSSVRRARPPPAGAFCRPATRFRPPSRARGPRRSPLHLSTSTTPECQPSAHQANQNQTKPEKQSLHKQKQKRRRRRRTRSPSR